MSKAAPSSFVSAGTAYEPWSLPSIRARDGLVIGQNDQSLDDELLRIPEFQQELEQLREQAKAEGYSLGKEQGYRQGLNQGKTEIQLIGDRLNELFENLIEPISEQDEALEDALLNLVVTISRQVVSEESVKEPELLRDTIQSAIRALPRGADNIKVFLNPSDKKLLTAVGKLPSAGQIEEDATLARGGCRVETNESTVDYGLDYRFRQAIAQQVRKQYSRQDLDTLIEPIELPELDSAEPTESDIADQDSPD